MRNHSQSSKKRAARDGGCAAPRPGRSPGGARNAESSPASRSMPSDWYEEKSRAADTKEMKSAVQRRHIARAQTFSKNSTDPSRPAGPGSLIADAAAPKQIS